jgi:hypothetical protein
MHSYAMRSPFLMVGAVLAAVSALAGCTGAKQLSASMASINHQYGTAQDEALFLNILRRSVSLPTHFTSLDTVRGRSRVTAGADIALPFGGDAPARFDLNSHLSIEQGPSFEISTQDNQEFYQGYVAPVGAITISRYLQQDIPLQLLLSLFIKRIHIRSAGSEEIAINAPSGPEKYRAFQGMLERLLDQGLALEDVGVKREVGPQLDMPQSPGIDQVLSIHKEGLTIEKVGKQQYQLLEVSAAARFCFRRPSEPLFERALCNQNPHESRLFSMSDPMFFGSTGQGRVVFSAGGDGSIELYTRSLAEVLDYLGEIIRAQQSLSTPLTIKTGVGQQPLFVVIKEEPDASALVSVEFAGTVYSIPGGPASGHSGAVLTIASQLLAQAKSIKDRPMSNTVTVVGD